MSRCLIEPCESLRLCFHGQLSAPWTLGKPVALSIALENEAGVLVRHPHSHCVWTEPDSPFVRRGFHCGVPLRVALEGDTTGRFLLHVTSSIANRTGGNDRALDGNGGDDDGNDDGIDDGRECPQRKELLLDLSTGVASGYLTISSADPSRKNASGHTMAIPSAPHDEARWYSTRTLAIQPAPASASVGVVTPRGEGAREKSATMVDEDRVSLSVSFAPEWTARFNRPVLALNSYYFKCVRPSATFPDGAAAAGAGVADAIVADAGAGAESLAHRQRRRAPAPDASNLVATPPAEQTALASSGASEEEPGRVAALAKAGGTRYNDKPPLSKGLTVSETPFNVRHLRFAVTTDQDTRRSDLPIGMCGARKENGQRWRKQEQQEQRQRHQKEYIEHSEGNADRRESGESEDGVPWVGFDVVADATVAVSSEGITPVTSESPDATYQRKEEVQGRRQPEYNKVRGCDGSDDGDDDDDGGSNRNSLCTDNIACPDANDDARLSADISAPYVDIFATEGVSLGGFFGRVWDCSLALGAYLAALGPGTMRGKRVIELGAGCGVVSNLCAALGASEVVATDERDLLAVMILNTDQNRALSGRLRNPPKVVEYVWGSPLHNQPGLCGGNFDIIICSDLLYDPAGWDLLKKSLRRLIKSGRDEVKESCAEEGKPGTGDRNEGGVIYLAHRIRNPQERDFFTSLKARDEDGTTFTCRMLFSGGERTRPPVEMGTVGGASRHDKNLRVDGSDREEDAVSWVGIGDFPDITLYELSLVRPVGGGSARVCTDEATA